MCLKCYSTSSPVVCRQRYHQDKVRYDKQFQYELKMLELMQNSAYDSMRFHRSVLSPPEICEFQTPRIISYRQVPIPLLFFPLAGT